MDCQLEDKIHGNEVCLEKIVMALLSNGDPDIHDYLFVQPLMDDKLLRRNKSLMTLKVISG